MRIGINASFLRKPGTGIGQVTFNFLEKLKQFPTRLPDGQVSIRQLADQFPINDSNSKIFKEEKLEFILYTEEPIDLKLPDNFRVRSFLPFWKRDDLLRKFLWEKQLVREAAKDHCDVFLSLYQAATIFHASSVKQHVMVVHDLIPRLFPEYRGTLRRRLYWRAVERAIRRADTLVAVSEATKHDLVEFGIDHERITVASPDTAPCFATEPSEAASRAVLEKYGLTPGYLYHGGGLEVRKNARNLLLAYQTLADKERSGTLSMTLPPLVISGKIFPESNTLATPVRTLVTELGLGDRVRLLDFVPEEDLPALYQQALFFIYPSLYEGFGLPVLEALRMGTPVLAADTSSLPEVAGDAALYIDPTSVASIASGMERLLFDSALREQLSAAARGECARFGWEHFVTTILTTLKNPAL